MNRHESQLMLKIWKTMSKNLYTILIKFQTNIEKKLTMFEKIKKLKTGTENITLTFIDN